MMDDSFIIYLAFTLIIFSSFVVTMLLKHSADKYRLRLINGVIVIPALPLFWAITNGPFFFISFFVPLIMTIVVMGSIAFSLIKLKTQQSTYE